MLGLHLMPEHGVGQVSCYNRMDVVAVKYQDYSRVAVFVNHDPDLQNCVFVLYPKTMHIARVKLDWVEPLDQRRYKLVKQGGRVSVVRRTRGRD